MIFSLEFRIYSTIYTETAYMGEVMTFLTDYCLTLLYTQNGQNRCSLRYVWLYIIQHDKGQNITNPIINFAVNLHAKCSAANLHTFRPL